MKRIAFTTLGCKANWSDTEALIQTLATAGFEIVEFDDIADIYVVNTCTVTRLADSQSRQMLRRARRRSPNAVVVAIGCYGETSREEIVKLGYVDAVFGTTDRANFIKYLADIAGMTSGLDDSYKSHAVLMPSMPQSRARAFVKIQEGCNKRCAYCIIPMARGMSTSVPLEEVVALCRKLSLFHSEIVLAGIDIGQYGRDLGKGISLLTLLERLNSIDGLARLHLSTLGPREINSDLADLLAHGNFCGHLHLSIQSCSDRVLGNMRRGYTVADVDRAVRLMASTVPDIAITGDVIAGFPAESENDHRASLDALASLPIAGLHVFPFSARRGTAGASMPGQLSHDVKRRRAFELRELAAGLRAKYLSGLIGKEFNVIVTSKSCHPEGSVEGVSDKGFHIWLPSDVVAYGEMGEAIVTSVSKLKVRGKWKSTQKKKQDSSNWRRLSVIASSAGSISSAL